MSEKKEKIGRKKDAAKKENRENKMRSRLLVIAGGALALAFAIYAVITLIGINAQLRERRAELDEINDEIEVQEIKNEEMSKLSNYTDEEFSAYIEQLARDDLDYVKSGERVFVNVSGD